MDDNTEVPIKNNLALWDSVQSTDKSYTKQFKGAGGFAGTSINATWLAKQATDKFGPMGIGWGTTIVNESYHEGHTLVDKETGADVGKMVIHKIQLELWYIWEGSLGRVQQFGQTVFVGQNKNGMFTDEEAPKKSMTDAMTKCLSLIGFSSDIYLGLYDDNKYVNTKEDEKPAKGKDSRSSDWKGPLTLTELKKQGRSISTEIEGIEDLDQLITYWTSKEVMTVCEQMKEDQPDWYDHDDGDFIGLVQRYNNKMIKLQAEVL